jgi:hypothetical protein
MRTFDPQPEHVESSHGISSKVFPVPQILQVKEIINEQGSAKPIS